MFKTFHSLKILLPALLLVLASFSVTHGQAWASQTTIGAASPNIPLAVSSAAESNLPYLYAVFTITWAAFFGYVFLMSKRQRDLHKEIEALKKNLEEKSKDSAQAEKK